MTTLAAIPRTIPILLYGQPNVGKSALFNALTGAHATVSNYPGTTVSVARGRWSLGADLDALVIDTPGAYSLLPITEEERVSRDALFADDAVVVVHVVDAKNVDRALPTTLELLDAGRPVVLVLNMIDEARELGIRIDFEELAERLGCAVVGTVAIARRGLDGLAEAVRGHAARGEALSPRRPTGGSLWLDEFGEVVDELAARVPANGFLPRLPSRTAVAFAIRGAADIAAAIGLTADELTAARAVVAERVGGMPPVAAILALRRRAEQLLDGVVTRDRALHESLRHRLGIWLAHPLLGLPALFAVLYLGFYQLVGVFAAGTVVGWLEEDLFGRWINPVLERAVTAAVPWEWLQALFVGEFGLLTLGITYALALVMPVVGAFFVVFSVVEDSGYLPRLALLCDRVLKRVGLNGRAVITMVLGLGCSTMATVTTRTLETRRERLLANLLLVLTIPCSAQLGLISALLGARGLGLWASYVAVLVAIFFVVGWLASRALPGRNATFHMDVAPMRVPRIGPVLRKTGMRLLWYFREVVPLFLLASVLLWALEQGQAMGAVEAVMRPVMTLIGMPVEAAESFLVGFFRRDFGAAGLFALAQSGVVTLTDRQLLCGSVTLTLFVPCVATFMMMWRERGPRLATAILVVVTAIAIAVGSTMNAVLVAAGME